MSERMRLRLRENAGSSARSSSTSGSRSPTFGVRSRLECMTTCATACGLSPTMASSATSSSSAPSSSPAPAPPLSTLSSASASGPFSFSHWFFPDPYVDQHSSLPLSSADRSASPSRSGSSSTLFPRTHPANLALFALFFNAVSAPPVTPAGSPPLCSLFPVHGSPSTTMTPASPLTARTPTFMPSMTMLLRPASATRTILRAAPHAPLTLSNLRGDQTQQQQQRRSSSSQTLNCSRGRIATASPTHGVKRAVSPAMLAPRTLLSNTGNEMQSASRPQAIVAPSSRRALND